MLAVQEGRSVDCLLMLLKHGADVNHQTKPGETAMTVARTKGHAELVEFLNNYKAVLTLLAGEKPAVPLEVMKGTKQFLF